MGWIDGFEILMMVIQASGAVVAGSSWAVVQSVAMGGALPLIGTVSAGAIGGAVGAAGGAVASHVRSTNGTDTAAGSDDGGPGGDGQPDEKDKLGDEERTETEEKKSIESTLPVSTEKSICKDVPRLSRRYTDSESRSKL
ncbi:hypothetical protein B0H13DRAFT_2120823 [Mycena leptocephala]|nr:hypothetical protein B0H13DRAFT_2120823 [Mycena leptocephala]